ncbi:MAG TPA: ATP-binding cassette domain-containing protein [Luteibacter sp.]|uniref:ABC transporter ATP-binding protein n=1 Tax=Luteibacter sp. TaxID=1886636 RepID=UPI002B7AE589|nr:ATP-binding cassette domain-containing protein [Luteibacter sp.]HVI53779.1 ATP-binding cassette domain-containing protein [Luteibacter sp.]
MTLFVEGLRSGLAGPFTFTVPQGQCLAITGASGSGKTVLLRMIADLDPHEGKVVFAGTDRASLPAPAWRRLAGLVPARSGWWADTVGEHFPSAREAEWQALAAELLVPKALFARSIEDASTGERQRLALIRALLAAPRLLLLDEPTASLDPVSTRAVETVVSQRIAAGTTVIWVTHDAAQAGRVGHMALQMRSGGVLAP